VGVAHKVIVIANGGSCNSTVEIAREFGCLLVGKPERTGETGKAWGIREASGEIIALVDSDNQLDHHYWLEQVTAPFHDPEIAGSEPLEYAYRRNDAPLTSYCTLMGMNDPLCYSLNNYNHFNAITGRWNGLGVSSTPGDSSRA